MYLLEAGNIKLYIIYKSKGTFQQFSFFELLLLFILIFRCSLNLSTLFLFMDSAADYFKNVTLPKIKINLKIE